jgi:hypothetical protein
MNRDSIETQRADILRYLEEHPEGITLFDAFIELGGSKLSTRVGEIIRGGWMQIEKIPEIRKYPNGKTKRFMRYRKAA